MSNNPVQIILNDSAFLRAPEPGRMGAEKDFFAKDEAAFVKHKNALLSSIDGISAKIAEWSFGPAAYLQVRMRPEALAKSYRPNRALFTPDNFPCVGAAGVGTLFFRAPAIYLDRLKRSIDAAESTVEVKINQRTGEPYKSPTRARSEVGAIDIIEIAPAAAKRPFSTQAAVEDLTDPATVSGYLLELFETPSDGVIADDPLGRTALLNSLEKLFASFGNGTKAYLAPSIGRTPVLELQLTQSDQPPFIENRRSIATTELVARRDHTEIDLSLDRHDSVLTKLAAHPLVRTIRPPVRLELADQVELASGSELAKLTDPAPEANYPVVGVIDSGVSEALTSWVVDRFDYLSEEDCDTNHGTRVGGLLAQGHNMNAGALAIEPTPCRLFDVPLYPKEPFLKVYPKGFTDFIEEIEQAVFEAKEGHNVRIFNLSINAKLEVEPHRYSIYAARLDEIADKHGVIFVNSAGNLAPQDARSPWHQKPGEVVKYFANRTQPDAIMKPAESVRSISVGALNPPATSHLEGAPTTYTRRGPGLQVGVKPDVAAYGGAGVARGDSSGLRSIDAEGNSVDLVGTSYAAPLVARTLAGLDAATYGGLSTEALKAMMLHTARAPYPLTRRGVKGSLDRQFAGFGQPVSAASMLETDDHEITMLFQSRLTVGERRPAILRFPFNWPASLVDSETGACYGSAKLTIVYSPPLDPAFGAEFVRVNLDASLRQRENGSRKDGLPSYLDRINPKYLPNSKDFGIPEKALINHGLKWWPSKQYEANFHGKGHSSEWRFEVASLIRAESHFPPEGVPFAAILTIQDPSAKEPIFQEMRQSLQASVANAVDIRTVTRIRPRR